ncbi:quinone oxidoreductase family protein [Lichenicoccus sp.]|uniref:quinone oxidoreductase family protein n=1 Tax=Lichenicoccus sp. TaxID=2781899 RepID=UPI003D0DF571
MKAIRIERYGGPEVLQLQDIPVPAPDAGEVLVRMAHAGINVMDGGTRKGAFANSQTYPVHLPTTIGMEGAGTVERVGAGVTGFRPGDRVAYCLVWNSHAEFAVVPAWQLVHVPPAVPLCLAAAATFQGFTAHYLATDVGRLGPGRSCLVHAATGGVGQLLVGFAARLGAIVYGTVRAEDDKRIARERGAHEVFLSGQGGFVAPLLELTGDVGVDVVFDSVGKPTLRDDFKVTRKKGLVVNFGASGGAVDDLNPAELGEAGSLHLTRPRLKDHLPDADTIQARAAALYAGLADGTLSLALGRRYAMEQISVAHADLEDGKAEGKPLLDIAEGVA